MATAEQAAMRVWRSFIVAKAEIGRALQRGWRASGLTGAQLGVLRVLAETGSGGSKLNEISEQLYVTPGNLTGIIDRLEEAGYLSRAPHPEDRRVTLASMTPTGRELFQQVYPSHTARIRQLMSVLTVREQKLLADLLSRLAVRAADMHEEAAA
jgi:MarR family 2-MHQ and catechol resistance regulon transcriptional repressor